MGGRVLVRTGVAGAVVAALCCATPILATVLGAIGLAAWASKADYVLMPVLLVSVILAGIGLYQRSKSKGPAASDCCDADEHTRKLKS
uniref:Mercuric transport protein n=1 Tax=Pseudomonas sp. K-62 TaxID=76885 RepID=I2FFZ3_9PSED|nr:mercury resistance system transport protein MerF [Pseudomonas sp. K-62]BAM13928.1 mercuric transport protein [Pseudomonas sp. K-62]